MQKQASVKRRMEQTFVVAGMTFTALGIVFLTDSVSGVGAEAQKAPAKQTKPAVNPLRISRANLAKSASFVVIQTIAPNGGKAIVRKFWVEIKGEKARLDYEDETFGPVRYLANEKGVFFYTPGNATAVKQTFKGGVEGALKVAFAQASERMAKAKKIGTGTVSGQPTTKYRDPETGTILYIGTRPGFQLPVKTELVNEGGSNILLVSDIKLNIAIADSRFHLPDGTQIIESKDAPGVGLPLSY